tara:strand:- start:4958 stop:5275 length:318 start_codon:yes stop_codon:yes gene_type:complete
LNTDADLNLKIEKQIARWDLYAKLAPVCFIIISVLLLWIDFVELDILFYISLLLTAITATTWWFWTIYTVRIVIRKMSSAANGLDELKLELEELKKNMIKPPKFD